MGGDGDGSVVVVGGGIRKPTTRTAHPSRAARPSR
jgi:hypothetical protein